mmetsp:Transcript_24533/g.64492  ORF Transcript_24533/g.64492 Transcript_24533/m.64492 type:complete len:107 (+) Transcript_24533:1055-1375(+)
MRPGAQQKVVSRTQLADFGSAKLVALVQQRTTSMALERQAFLCARNSLEPEAAKADADDVAASGGTVCGPQVWDRPRHSSTTLVTQAPRCTTSHGETLLDGLVRFP